MDIILQLLLQAVEAVVEMVGMAPPAPVVLAVTYFPDGPGPLFQMAQMVLLPAVPVAVVGLPYLVPILPTLRPML
jgi:hypothetical protein